MVALEKARNSLLERRERLVTSINQAPSNAHLTELLEQVDAALSRVSAGTYGTCEICKQPIEDDRLRADPLLRSCTSHLAPGELGKVASDKNLASIFLRAPNSPTAAAFTGFFDLAPREEILGATAPADRGVQLTLSKHKRNLRQRLLEALRAAWAAFDKNDTAEQNLTDDRKKIAEDTNRAHRLQSMLLPKPGSLVAEWECYYDYAPAGAVGGDYCDLVAVDGKLYFLLGDAVGKGIAGSMIASQLHSLFRALLPMGLSLSQLFERINRIFCESAITDYYATLVCGRGSCDGTIELVNAGHLPPILLRSGQGSSLAATGLPLGLFYTSTYDVTELKLVPRETLLFYTDGITEARNSLDVEYGTERLMSIAIGRCDCCAEELVRALVNDVVAFTAGLSLQDDRTVMALRHAPRAAAN
jgi:phosphoserine phosphatase RsbU/P